MFLDILTSIEEKRRERFISISDNRLGQTAIDNPPKGCAGIYFFYTSYTNEELASTEPLPGKAVPISKLTLAHQRLPGICNLQERDGFRLVYNGIGGFNGKNYDLRTRILQEISSTDSRTGSLCIKQSTVNDLSKWRFSYVVLHSANQRHPADFPEEWSFNEHAQNLERCWRLVHGWPLLCRT